MAIAQELDTEVLVVGAGPSGWTLAHQLRTAGVSVCLVERLGEPDDTIKAGAVGPLAVEALYRAGLREALEEAESEAISQVLEMYRTQNPDLPQEVTQETRTGFASKGHFAALFKIDATRRADAERRMMVVSQHPLELLLEKAARDAGVEVLRQHTVRALTQDTSGVTLTVETPDGTRTLRSRWLVGCDGGRSTVRKLGDFAFPGTAPTMTGRQCVAEIENPDALLPLGWRRTPTGVMAYGPSPGRIFLAEFDGPPDDDRDESVTVQEIQAAARRVSGSDVRITGLRSATRFTDNARQATNYRDGRVFLAGDAAHVHSPFGGQGLNIGILDAVNLAWKLAAEVQGWAPDGLLDSYTAEQHPVAARVLANTRAQIALMRPGPHVDALREIFSELLDMDEVNQYFGRMLGSFATCHPMPYDGEAAGSPLLGRPCPDLPLHGSATRLSELTTPGRGLLLDLGADPRVRAAAEGWTDRVEHVSARLTTSAPTDEQEPGALLLRPDGVVAWSTSASTSAPAGTDLTLLRQALTTWFGTPT